MKEISVEGLRSWEHELKAFVLVDVREEWEHSTFNIGGKLLPLSVIMQHRQEIPSDLPVILYCEKGIRSAIAIQRLEATGLKNLYNLTGGMSAWRKLS